jgi:hypothetical protein
MQRGIQFLFITECKEKFSVNITSNGDGGKKKKCVDLHDPGWKAPRKW